MNIYFDHYIQKTNYNFLQTKNVPKELVEQRKKEIQRGFDKMIEYLEGTKYIINYIFKNYF